MAKTQEADKEGKGPSLVVQLGLFAGLTVLAVGMGWLAGGRLGGHNVEEAPGEVPEALKLSAEEIEETAPPARPNVLSIAPITTNLALPREMWARLELALVFQGDPDLALADTVHQDLLAYLRTVKLHQIESASGFQHLKWDLQERARVRSDGRVTDVLIKTLLFE